MEATPTPIISYFSGFKQNLVPLFQRPYTWGERQWRTLWEDIITFYGRAANDPKSTHFLGAVVTMPARSVYAAIKRLVADSDAPSVRLLMIRMEQLSILYSRITTGAPEPNAELGQFFDRFRRLDFGTAYPLLLSLYEDYVDGQFACEEFLASMRILDSYIVRRMVVGVPSNSLSGVFISLCKIKPITDSPSAWLSAALARESKNRRWPTDSEFFEGWLRTPLYGSRVCQVILECIEAQFGHHESVVFSDATVEHILPQTLTPEWEQALGDNAVNIQAEWLHTIGNLTFTGYNPELGNKEYREKREIFALSHFELNRYFGNYETWGVSQIQKRAQSLFETAKQVWPRPAIVSEQEPSAERVGPANFHTECIRAAEKRLHVVLSKLSQTRYASGDKDTRLVCAVSAEHNEGGGIPYFWFAVHLKQLEFLEGASSAWLCFGCGSPRQTLLVPASFIKPFLTQMSVSTGDDRHYWHVVIQGKGGKLVLRLLGAIDGPDLTEFFTLPNYADATKLG
jgi:hypothetical protein